jgi:hypothetical protein
MIVQNELYQHYKGEFYIVIAIGKHTETEEDMVCYRAATKEEYWFCPLSMWEEPVEHKGRLVPHFKHISVLSKSQQKRIKAQTGE